MSVPGISPSLDLRISRWGPGSCTPELGGVGGVGNTWFCPPPDPAGPSRTQLAVLVSECQALAGRFWGIFAFLLTELAPWGDDSCFWLRGEGTLGTCLRAWLMNGRAGFTPVLLIPKFMLLQLEQETSALFNNSWLKFFPEATI